jgi:hypothetical protein
MLLQIRFSHLAQVGQPDDALGVRLQIAQLHDVNAAGRLRESCADEG